jgi:type I restriction enzyme S subunit
MAGRDMAMNQTCYALIGKKNFGQHFIYMQTISIVERMKKKANGAVFSAITTRDFDSEKIIIPSLDIVSDYLMKIEPLYESILHNQQEITHLTNLRDTLLPKLMSGEIDVEQFNVIE